MQQVVYHQPTHINLSFLWALQGKQKKQTYDEKLISMFLCNSKHQFKQVRNAHK